MGPLALGVGPLVFGAAALLLCLDAAAAQVVGPAVVASQYSGTGATRDPCVRLLRALYPFGPSNLVRM